jgi:hypothetical protein
MTTKLIVARVKGDPSSVRDSGLVPRLPFHSNAPKSCSSVPNSRSRSRQESGYSADRESNSSYVQLTIDSQERNMKRECPTMAKGEHAKRLKSQELAYRAANAKSELTRYGLPVPAFIPRPGIGAEHKYSGTYDRSPLVSSDSFSFGGFEDMVGVAGIVASCREMYGAFTGPFAQSDSREEQPCPNADESSTSSFTDTESGASASDEDATKSCGLVSIGDALSIVGEARCVLFLLDVAVSQNCSV